MPCIVATPVSPVCIPWQNFWQVDGSGAVARHPCPQPTVQAATTRLRNAKTEGIFGIRLGQNL